jgi:hypothetical protein
MRWIPIVLALCAGASLGVWGCREDGGFSGIAHTSSTGPDLIGPDDPNDWQPRCESGGSRPCFFPAYPNPTTASTYIPFLLADSSAVEVYVEIAPGRRARTFGVFPVSAGQHIVFWDAKDDAGDDMPNGIYRVWLKVTGVSDGAKHTSYGDVEVRRP